MSSIKSRRPKATLPSQPLEAGRGSEGDITSLAMPRDRQGPRLDLPALLGGDQRLLARFLDTIGDALFVVDAQQTIIYWNKQAERLTGFSAEEVLGQHCLAGIRCERCLYECKLFQKGILEDARISLGTKEGKTLQVRKNAFVLRDEGGAIIGGVEILRDETELVERIESCRSQRETIAERERLQAALLGSIREGVITIDPSYRITSFSRRAEEITGHRAEDVIGRHCHDVIPSVLCDTDCPAEHCLQTGAQEAERTTETVTLTGDPLPMAEIAVPLRARRGTSRSMIAAEAPGPRGARRADVAEHSTDEKRGGPGRIGAQGEEATSDRARSDETGKELGTVLLLEDRRATTNLETELDGASSYQGIIGRSKVMRRLFQVVDQVAPTEVTVLLTGESGTGKELVAKAIHQRSGRRAGPFQAINCAALPETLLESELFGHTRGAFTGADRTRPGRIEAAAGGSLFLDEIGEMSLALQAKLLRFLQEHEYQRVGDNETRTADVRVLAATNRDLKGDVASGRFREDLYYRIRVIPIELPPLRERRDDISLLGARLLGELAPRRGRPGLQLTPAAMKLLVDYHWPGNVRELVNALEYAVALAPGRRIRPADLPPELTGRGTRYSASEVAPGEEASRIREALALHRGNRTATAQYLGMDRVTLYRKMKKLKIAVPGQ